MILMELHILKNLFAEMLSNDDDSRFYCTSRWTSVGGTCSISYVLTSKVCILVILHIIMIMLTKSNSKKKTIFDILSNLYTFKKFRSQ